MAFSNVRKCHACRGGYAHHDDDVDDDEHAGDKAEEEGRRPGGGKSLPKTKTQPQAGRA